MSAYAGLWIGLGLAIGLSILGQAIVDGLRAVAQGLLRFGTGAKL